MRDCIALEGLAILLVIASPSAIAQPVAAGATTAYVPTMTFDVASVHATQEADSYTVFFKNDPHTSMVQLQNNSVDNLLSIAYGVREYQLINLPRWPWPAMFTINAKSDADTDAKLAKLSTEDAALEKQHMLQALLADRFKLQVHWETREGDVYNLVVAKGGPKMQPPGSLPPTAKEKEWMTADSGSKPRPLHQENDGHGYDWVGHSCNIGNFVSILSSMFGRPVIDKTGLTGDYDFVVRYRGRFDSDRKADDNDPMLPLDSAIQNDLGLKVEKAKGPIRVLVIDHIEKPSGN